MADYIVKKIQTTVQGTYLLKVPEGKGPFGLFVTFHGYSGNAGENISHALTIPGIENWIVCSVQSISQFYTEKERSGYYKSGGCWITFNDPEQTIADIVGYVDAVIDTVQSEYPCSDKLVFMGFSQGTIPAWSLAAYGKHNTAGVITVGYHIFSKLDTSRLKDLPAVLLGRGDKDVNYSKEKMEHNKEVLEKLGIKVTTCTYDAGHGWHPDFFEIAGKWLLEV